MNISFTESFVLLTVSHGSSRPVISDSHLACGLAGAILLELEFLGRVDSDREGLWVVNPTPTGDQVLDHALSALVSETRRCSPRYWVHRLASSSESLHVELLRRLCDRQILKYEVGPGLWRRALAENAYWLNADNKVPNPGQHLLALLQSDEIPNAEDAGLLALADACFVFPQILTKTQLSACKERIERLTHLDMMSSEMSAAAKKINTETRQRDRNAMASSFLINILVWADFMAYGLLANEMAKVFFPSQQSGSALLLSFAVMGAGLLARPLGGYLFGELANRRGASASVMWAIYLMIFSTMMLGLLPTYEQVGVLAPLLLLAVRIMQGLGAGGSYSGSMANACEMAQPRRRALVTSFAFVGATVGEFVAALFVLLYYSAVGSGLLPPSVSWRAPFLVMLSLLLLVPLIRRLEKAAAPKDDAVTLLAPSDAASKERSGQSSTIRHHAKLVFQVILSSAYQPTVYFISIYYVISWLQAGGRFDPSTAMSLGSFQLVLTAVLVPVCALVVDRIGAKAVALLACFAAVVFTLPLFFLMSSTSLGWILVGQAGMGLLAAATGASLPIFAMDAFPKHLRRQGLGLTSEGASAFFGGIGPVIAIWLLETTHDGRAPSIYLMAIAALSALSVLTLGRKPTHG